MTKKPPARLGASFVQKGEAKPIGTADPPKPSPEQTALIPEEPTQLIPEETPVSPIPKTEAKPLPSQAVPLPTKSLTVKVDLPTYTKLKTHGAQVGKTNQEIFIEALFLYFKKHGIK